MTALNGIEFDVPGIAWRSTCGLHVADIVPGAAWAACTDRRLGRPGTDLRTDPFADGAARVLEERAGTRENACLTRLIVTTDARFGACRGFGGLSTRAAEAVTAAAAAQLGVAEANALFMPAGGVLGHLPVGEVLAALQQASSARRQPAPQGGDARLLGLRALGPDGPVRAGAGCFVSAGLPVREAAGEVWLAATDAAVSRGVLDGLLERLWLTGPAALRQAAGGAHPADALLLVATGCGVRGREITDGEDPRLVPVAGVLSAAIGLVARFRAREEGLAGVRLEGAADAREAALAAERLAPMLAALRRRFLATPGDGDSLARALPAVLRTGLVSLPLPGLERSLVRARVDDVLVLDGFRRMTARGDCVRWFTGQSEMEVHLGRGRSGACFFC